MTYPNPHDRFFKKSMSNLSIARDFFSHHLPAALLKKIDLDSLCLQSGSFIGEKLEQKLTDILYKVDMGAKSGYLYLLAEHQSTADYWMPLRVQRYVCEILLQHIEQHKLKEGKLPCVYPLVFYHGKKSPYPGPIKYQELFEDAGLGKELLENTFQLIDLTQVSDLELRAHQRASLMELLQL